MVQVKERVHGPRAAKRIPAGLLPPLAACLAVSFAVVALAGCEGSAAGRREGQARSAAATQPAMAGDIFLFVYRAGPQWRTGAPMEEQGLGPHAVYMQKLFSEGRLFAGGRFLGRDGGMAMVVASSADEARILLAADPAITSGIFVATLEHWRPRFRSDTPLPH